MAGNNPREYIYFGGQAMARRDSNPGSPYYRFTDHLGSLRVLTDSTGVIKQELDYDPFGAEISVISNPQIDDAYRFISRERDAESLNDHYWFRQFSPRLGRWCSADPLGGWIDAPQSLNRYSYVSNDPLNYIDPLGLDDWCGPGCHFVSTGADQGYCDCWANGGGGPPNPGQCYDVYIDGVYSGNTCNNIAPFIDGAGTPDVASNQKSPKNFMNCVDNAIAQIVARETAAVLSDAFVPIPTNLRSLGFWVAKVGNAVSAAGTFAPVPLTPAERALLFAGGQMAAAPGWLLVEQASKKRLEQTNRDMQKAIEDCKKQYLP